MKRRAVLVALLLSSCLAADLQWTARLETGSTPPGAIVLERNAETAILLCRAWLDDRNLHPGITSGDVCAIPQKGVVEKLSVFEIAVGGRAAWSAGRWEDAVKVGRQGPVDLYFCRAPIRAGNVAVGWAYGKAYREGPHAGHCYVGFQGREVGLSENFELFSTATDSR